MAESKPFTCPKCGGRLAYEAWEPVHYSIDPVTGAIGTTGSRQGEALDSQPLLVCKGHTCDWTAQDGDFTADLQRRRVTAITAEGGPTR